MAKYLAIKKWHGVKVGDTVEFDGEVPKALRANVRQVPEDGKEHKSNKKDEAPTLPPVAAPAKQSK